jgi:imidazolonepropionase-like amidohydrolase
MIMLASLLSRPCHGLLLAAFFALTAVRAQAADKPVDRSAWYVDTAPTSDDLRRVPVPKGYLEPAGAIVIKDGRVFDGRGGAPKQESLLIEGSHIVRIAPTAAALDAPVDALVIDAAGKTVMPGLIDLHTHLTYEDGGDATVTGVDDSQAAATLRGAERLRYYLESGVTSVRDVASAGLAPFVLKQWVAEGRLPGPRVFPVGQLITGVGGHGAEGDTHTAPGNPDAQVYEANGPDGFRLAVRTQFKRGADWIKLASHFTREEVAAAVDEAHMLGIRATVDSETIYTQMAVEAGIDCVEHPLPRSDATIKLMQQQGTCAVITLVPYQYINALGGYNFATSRRFSERDDVNLAMAKKLQAAGLKIGIGTDLVVGWYKYLPDAYLQELRNFQSLGHTAAQALVEATRVNAEILGMSDRLGTIEPGKLADLLIVPGVPDQTIEDLRQLDSVIVNGRVVMQGGRVFVARHTQEKPPFSTSPP